MTTRTPEKSGSPRQGLVSLLLIVCALIAWILWLGHKEASYEEQERLTNAERVERLQELSYWIQHPAESIPELLQCLREDDVVGRRLASLALYQIGPKARECLPEFVSAIDDEDVVVRRYALLALTRLDADLRPWTEQIASRLLDDDPTVREAAVRAIAHIGTPAALAVSRKFVSCGDNVSPLLMIVLSYLGTDDPDALARMHQMVRNEAASPGLRSVPFFTLHSIGQLDAEDVIAGLRSDDPRLERAALQAITELRLTGPALTEAFEKFLIRPIKTDDSQQMQMRVARTRDPLLEISAAWRLGGDRKRLASRLQDMFAERKYFYSAELLLLHEIDREEALRLLPRCLEWATDLKEGNNQEGWSSLQAFGADAAQCLPAVLEHLRRRYESEIDIAAPSQNERQREGESVHVGSAPAGRLARMSNQDVNTLRWVDSHVFGTLGSIGPAARDAVPLLIAWLKLPPESFTPDYEPFSPPRGRALAIDALRRIGGWNADVGECLERLRTDDSPDVRRTALAAMAELDADHSRPIEALVAALEDPHCLVRRAAASALGGLGSAAMEAVPALRKSAEAPENAIPPRIILLGDEQILVLHDFRYGPDARLREPTVRECALQAIERIEDQ